MLGEPEEEAPPPPPGRRTALVVALALVIGLVAGAVIASLQSEDDASSETDGAGTGRAQVPPAALEGFDATVYVSVLDPTPFRQQTSLYAWAPTAHRPEVLATLEGGWATQFDAGGSLAAHFQLAAAGVSSPLDPAGESGPLVSVQDLNGQNGAVVLDVRVDGGFAWDGEVAGRGAWIHTEDDGPVLTSIVWGDERVRVATLEPDDRPTLLAAGPWGFAIAYTANGATGPVTRVLDPDGGLIRDLAGLAVGTLPGGLVMSRSGSDSGAATGVAVDPNTGEETPLPWLAAAEQVVTVRTAPAGDKLATVVAAPEAGETPSYELRFVTGGEVRATFPLPNGGGVTAWSGDGRYLAFGGNPLSLYDTETGSRASLELGISREHLVTGLALAR